VIIPLPRDGEILKLYKVSRRWDLDISTFSAAVRAKKGSGVFSEFRIAFGGVGPTVVRLRRTEEALREKPLTSATVDAIADVVHAEIATITDVRGSAEYRKLVATNILKRFCVQTCDASNGRPA
jgi:xanthine dehydrogenase small subunit